MKKQSRLALAIAKAITGSVLTAVCVTNALASSTYYNTANAYASNVNTDKHGADGWANESPIFAGWTSPSTPYGFNNDKLHWAAEITTAGDSLTVSSQDAHDRYGIWADIDTAKGAWYDGVKGWEHNTDVGLFRANVATDVIIRATALQPAGSSETWSNFGISVYAGIPEGTWNSHGQWNCPSCVNNGVRTFPTFDSDNPLSASGLTYLTYDATVNSSDGIAFHANAGQIYTILLGGNSGGTNFAPFAGYSLSVTTSAVPIPSAIWLFGSALVGLVSAQRRKQPS